LIQNGKSVERGEYPWMVALFEKNPKSGKEFYFCGGTLISNKKVLTGKKYFFIIKKHTLRLPFTM
jgi:secreted trypsin-like serine protease